MQGTVFSGRLITVRVDGRGHELVDHPAAVVVVALDEEDRAWMVRVPRAATGGSLVEAPAGLVDEGETPEQAARRELKEECGLEAESWELMASGYSSPGFTDERISLFLARGLREVGGEDPDGQVEARLRMPLQAAIALPDPSLPSLAALLLAATRARR